MSTEDEDANWIAHSALVKFYDVFNKFRNISLAALAASALIILSFFMIMIGGPFEEGNAITKIGITLMSGAGLWVTISLVWIVRWMFINRKLRGRLLQVRHHLAYRSYVTTFELVRPDGKTKIDRICNHLSLVFPEVQQLKKRLEEPPWYLFWLKKHRKFSEREESLLYPKNETADTWDLETATGTFLLVIFKTTVKWEDVEKMIKVNNRDQNVEKLIGGNIMRIIYLADEYDSFFETDDFVSKMTETKRKFKLDLIKENNLGYSTIWIDR